MQNMADAYPMGRQLVSWLVTDRIPKTEEERILALAPSSGQRQPLC